MADYITTDTELTSIANAIRTKGGTSASLVYPSGFVSAINNIPSGGGGSTDVEDEIIMGTISGAYENSRVTMIRPAAFYNCNRLTSVNFPNVSEVWPSAFFGCDHLSYVSIPRCTSIYMSAFCSAIFTEVSFSLCTAIDSYAFSGCKSLMSISFPLCAKLAAGVFAYCSMLQSAYFPSALQLSNGVFNGCNNLSQISFPVCTSINTSTFYQCSVLQSAIFPSCSRIGSSAFRNCYSLSIASFPVCTSISSGAFSTCTNLVSLYLLGSEYASLAASNAFYNTPIGGYSAVAGQYGSIFVKASMLSTWKTMSVWSYFSSRFVGLTDEQIAALSKHVISFGANSITDSVSANDLANWIEAGDNIYLTYSVFTSDEFQFDYNNVLDYTATQIVSFLRNSNHNPNQLVAKTESYCSDVGYFDLWLKMFFDAEDNNKFKLEIVYIA